MKNRNAMLTGKEHRRVARRLAFVCISIFSFAVSASELRGIFNNNDGVKKYTNKKTVEAYDKFTESLIDLPFNPEVHFNLGNTFANHKEFDKALQEFETAARLAKDPGMRYKSLFNAAAAATEKKQTDVALNYYQQALEIIPDSKEVKTNIELLIQNSGGGGQGEQDPNNPQNQDQKGGGKQQQGPEQKPKQKPKPFNSQDLSEQDVGRILEELKRQEEEIRAKMQREGAKDVPNGKDW